MTRIQGILPGPMQTPWEADAEMGYVLDDKKGKEWHKLFKEAIGLQATLLEKPTAAEVDMLAGQVHKAMQ
jgi:hypothetical protein